jgi:small subunit ribosomal protein S20
LANHKSAIKRAGQNFLKTLEKKLCTAVKEGSDKKEELLKQTQSALQKASRKGIIHKKTASRKISCLFRFASKQQTVSVSYTAKGHNL